MSCAAATESVVDAQSSATSTAQPCFDTQRLEVSNDVTRQIVAGKTVELECYVKNKGDFSVAWLHQGQLISAGGHMFKPIPNVKLDTDSDTKFNLIISAVKSEQNGSYTCQISTLDTNNELTYNLDVLGKWTAPLPVQPLFFFFSTSHYFMLCLCLCVCVSVPPSIKRTPSSDVIVVEEGDSTSVECAAPTNV